MEETPVTPQHDAAIPAPPPPPPPPRRDGTNWTRWILIGLGVVVVGAAVYYFFFRRPDHSDEIVIPYIAHQKPTVDPHLPSAVPLSDKLDEVEFDGLFDLSANPSGIVYENGLGELVGIDQNNVVTIRLRQNRKWHDSYQVVEDGDHRTIKKATDHFFSARDLMFTLKRIQALGSQSPDFILVSQAVPTMTFDGPDAKNEIHLQFRSDRIWKEDDIKEVLSFKILPDNADMNALNYAIGTAAYMALPPKNGVSNYYRTPEGPAKISNILLSPFVDNSTFTTELRNGNINVLLETPFGSLSPILRDNEKYFAKSNISTTFFAVLFNTERLSLAQRNAVRALLSNQKILDRFFKVGTPQQRDIIDYKGNRNNYRDYLNYSVFPSTSYYVDEKIVTPNRDPATVEMSALPDTVRIKACVNFGFREEYNELIDILNDPTITRGHVKATAVSNDEIRRGNYDAVLIAFSGYRSNFLFDLYNVFLREPDLENYKVNLVTLRDAKDAMVISPTSLRAANNFFRLDASATGPDQQEIARLLEYIYGFMSTTQVGDKQEYARRVDNLENHLALGAWLFSEPSLAYFSTQFDSTSIDLYGVASQLSTIKKWKEKEEH